jgi:hypothetical protein
LTRRSLFRRGCLLPIKLFARSILVFFQAGLLLAATLACAQTENPGEAFFSGIQKSDRVSKTGPTRDGKPDAAFSFQMPAIPGNQTISEIQIQAVSGAPGVWTTAAKGGSYIGLADPKTPNDIINKKRGPLNLKIDEPLELLLYVTDDGTLTAEDRRYQIKVIKSDASSRVVPVKTLSSEKLEQASPSEASDGRVRMSAINIGLSQYDAVGPYKVLQGDDKPDGLFQLTLEARDKVIKSIEVGGMDSASPIWDTIPGSKAWALGVALTNDPVHLLNKADGTISVPLGDRIRLNLYLADNGDIAKGTAAFRVGVTFTDGERAWCPVKNESAIPNEPSKVNFIGTWLGSVTTDAVGKFPGLKPDGQGDACFGLDIDITPRNNITGIEIKNLEAGGDKWGTTGTTQGAWGLGVAYQTAPKALINKPDGSVNIPVSGRVQFFLYVADPGDLASKYELYHLIVHLADGRSFHQPIKTVPGSTSSVLPGGEEPKVKGVINCEFRGFIADLVNTTHRPGKDGFMDGTFILKLQVEDKKIAKIDIKSIDNVVRWSTEPKGKEMLLGVAVYPRVYDLMNAKGTFPVTPVSGKKTFFMYAADNGMLSDPKTGLIVTVTFTDKTTLYTDAK